MIKKANSDDLKMIEAISKENKLSLYSLEALDQLLKVSDIYDLLVYKEDELIGFIILWHSEGFGEIIDIAVKKDMQNKGIGSLLLKEGLSLLKEKDTKEVTLEVRKSNKHAVRLYEKFGFEFLKEIPNYYKDEDALVYRWIL